LSREEAQEAQGEVSSAHVPFGGDGCVDEASCLVAEFSRFKPGCSRSFFLSA
jgi:hypothetical protein